MEEVHSNSSLIRTSPSVKHDQLFPSYFCPVVFLMLRVSFLKSWSTDYAKDKTTSCPTTKKLNKQRVPLFIFVLSFVLPQLFRFQPKGASKSLFPSLAYVFSVHSVGVFVDDGLVSHESIWTKKKKDEGVDEGC